MAEITFNKDKDRAASIVKINQDYFSIEIWIYNLLPNFEPLQIPFTWIDHLIIEESLLNWNTRGYIVMNNFYEILERGVPAFKTESETPPFYSFRTDGRNRLTIKIEPLDGVEEGSVFNEMPKEWKMHFDCVIYDVQDVSDANDAASKKRAYYFKDERHQILSERRIEWSTGLEVELNPDGITDEERSLNGSTIIQKLLQKASMVEGLDKETVKVGYSPSNGSIKKPTIPLNQLNPSEWDPGSGTKFFYTSPAYHTVLDDINYILTKTFSSDGSPVVLDYGRNLEDKNWKLHPISYFFKNSKENQIEILFIDDGSDNTDYPPSVNRADTTDTSNIRNFTSALASKIRGYQFSNMVPLDTDRIVNRSVCYYDDSEGVFHIKHQGNKASDALEKVKKISENLFTFSSQNTRGKQIIFNLNETKQKGGSSLPYLETAKTKINPNNDLLISQGINMAKDLIFLNQTISFQVPGLTLRTPGKFIYINRTTSDDNIFNNKFLGQWMLVNVKHLFSKMYYTNEIVAIKPDAQQKLWEEKESII